MKILIYAGFAASLVSTIRDPSWSWAMVTIVLAVVALVFGFRSWADETFKSG